MGGKNKLSKLEIFDFSVFFGRAFLSRKSAVSMSRLIEMNADPEMYPTKLRIELFLAARTMISFVEDPLRYYSIINAEEILLISQGLLLKFKIRLPEASDLFLAIHPFAIMERESIYFKQMSVSLTEASSDRYNKELITCYKRESNFRVSHSLLFNGLIQHMGNFDKYTAGRCYDFNDFSIADIDAEFIRLPKYTCVEWLAKSMRQFISNILLKKNNVSLEMFVSQSHGDMVFDNDNLAQRIVYAGNFLEHYKTTISFIPLLKEAHKDKIALEASRRSQYNKMVENAEEAKAICDKIGLSSNYFKNDNLLLRFKKNKEKTTNTQDEGLIFLINDPLSLNLQISQLSFGNYQYNYLLSKTLNQIDGVIGLISANDERFYLAFYYAILYLARLGRIEYAYRDIFKSYKQSTTKVLDSFHDLEEGIEKYQHGMWLESSRSFHKFNSFIHEYFDYNSWIANLERSWYLVIVNTWGKNGVYLPVNCLNYVHEDSQSLEQDEDIDPNYTVLHYERQVDLQNVDEKEALAVIHDIFRLYKNTISFIDREYPHLYQMYLVTGFNMISTLITNSRIVTNELVHITKDFIEIISETEYLHHESVDRFCEYFESQQAILQFKEDFLVLSDEDKNYALYYDVSEDAQNQYFIHLKIRSVSDDPNAAAKESYQNHIREKNIRIMAMKRLAKRLALPIQNKKLARKSENIMKKVDDLSDCHVLWLMKSRNFVSTLKALCSNSKLSTILSKHVEYNINQLYNIFCSHYTIKNSFDIHFIVDSIEKLNNASLKALEDLETRIEEIYAENSKADESFNPFIEISQEEEVKFAPSEVQDKIDEATKKAVNYLTSTLIQVCSKVNEWLSQKAAPEQLNTESKQQVLKQKLKWEKMFASKEKLAKLKKLLRKYK